MLHNVSLGKVAIRRMPYTPAFLLPLVGAAEEGQPLEPALNNIVEELGFETFMFAMSVNPRGHHETRAMCSPLFLPNGSCVTTKWRMSRLIREFSRHGTTRCR